MGFWRISVYNSNKFKSLCFSFVSAVVFQAVGVHSAHAIDLDIENDEEYGRLIDAMRAAEYVRSDVIVADNPKPRVYAGLAAMMAYAERNPLANDQQLEAFLYAFDVAVQAYVPGDPDLNERASLYGAVRFARVQGEIFSGTDTRVGERALELLGISIPNPDGFESIQRRMVRFEVALARPLDYRNEVFDLLVAGFFGRDSGGNDRGSLSSVLDNYFEQAGFDPQLGSTRLDRANIDAGLALCPADYAAYTLAISEGPENMALRDTVTAQLDTVRVQIDSIVGTDSMTDDGSLDFALATGPGLAESVELAMDDPAYVQQVLDDLHANLEATAQARAAASAATYLMLQSDFEDIGAYASYTRDYSELALETNDTMAGIQSGVSIVGNLAIGVAGFYYGDPLTAAGAFLNVATEGLGLIAGIDAPPSIEEQTFDQIVQLRQQVEEMRQEMNARFDRIDQQLNIMYNTMISGFDALGDQIGDLQGDVDGLVREMAAARSQLRRLEAALYGVAQDILLSDLTNETNVVLDYRDENGIDLPYSGGSPDFITASESFFTYATLTSLSEAFVGSRSNPNVTLGNADEFIGDGPVASYLNDLAVLPQSLGLPALAISDLPGIEPWSQAASAYAQLARENPWYFAYRYNRQLEDYNSDPQNESLPELDRIIQSGDQLMNFVEAIRDIDMDGNSALFTALVENYKDAAAGFQAAINAKITTELPAVFSNNDLMLDVWMGELQADVSSIVPEPDNFDLVASSNDLDVFSTDTNNLSYNTFTDAADDERAKLLQIWHLMQMGKQANPSSFRFRAEIVPLGPPTFEYFVVFWIGDSNTIPEFASKSFICEIDFLVFSSWQNFIGNQADAAIALARVWSETRPYQGYDYLMGFRTCSDTDEPARNDRFRDNFYRFIIEEESNDTLIEVDDLFEDLFDYRQQARDAVLLELFDENSALSNAARELDRAEALIDAYVTIGMPKELDASEVLRSALRAVPGTSELGLGSIDMITMIDDFAQADGSDTWVDQEFNITKISEILEGRIDLVHEEITRGLERPGYAPDYVGWVLRELEHLRDTAFSLTTDDHYVADQTGSVMVGGSEGLLTNDVDQEFRSIHVDTLFVNDPAYIAPVHGMLELSEDGSFVYQADPGFVGSDSFTYRSMSMIDGVVGAIYSDVGTVVINVPSGSCSEADLTGDGVLNFLDVSAFLLAFSNQDTAADFDKSGGFNFLDVSAFLAVYGNGCP
jgi:Bacterial Ig domain